MKYIINGIVEYDAVNGTLLSPESSLEMITLSRVTSELLLILIKNNQHPLSREKLLHDLWESKGLSASSNNLNNYMSMLRKALMQCGCPDLITTIPKYGFVFEAEIEEGKTPLTPENVSDASENKKEPEPSFSSSEGGTTRIKMGMHPWGMAVNLIIIAGIIMALVAGGLRLYNDYRLSTIRSELFQLDQCRFYTGDDQTRSQDPDEVIDTIKNILVAENIKCKVKANVYYFSDKMQDASGHAIMENLLSYCPYSSKAFCINYYSTTHVTHDEYKK